MPAWIAGIQGIREILNSTGTALTRRKQMQFGAGFTAADDGTRTVITLGNPSSGYAAALAPLLRGIGLTVNSSNQLQVRVRPRKCQIQDFFLTGPGAGATVGIGKLNWNLLGSGTPAIARSATTGVTSTSKLSLVTTATSGHRSSLLLGSAENQGIALPTDLTILQCAVNFNGSLATKRFFFGLQGDFSQEPSAATTTLGIYYDSAVSPNWQIVARNGATGSPVVTSLAVNAANSHLLTMYQSAAGTWEFHASHTTQADVTLGSISTNIPTAVGNIGFRNETLAASASTMRLGYFGMTSETLAGVYNDDTFLEV